MEERQTITTKKQLTLDPKHVDSYSGTTTTTTTENQFILAIFFFQVNKKFHTINDKFQKKAKLSKFV